MNLTAIRQLLPTVNNLDDLYQAYCDETGETEAGSFMVWLYQRGHVDIDSLTWVADLEPVASKEVKRVAQTIVLGDRKSGNSVRIRARPSSEELRMIETLGEGGMGVVSLARDPALNRYVAYKRLREELSRRGDVVERFNFEAQVTAQLDHPGIVPVYSFNAGEGYAMKLVPGRTLTQAISTAREQHKSETIDTEHSLSVMLEHFVKVCDAVHFAHVKGVVHRDLKPDNVLIGRYNDVYVVDWGIARLMSLRSDTLRQSEPTDPQALVELPPDQAELHPKTQHGDIIGSMGYMSPEQVRGDIDSLGPQSDVFCLGLILFEIVTLQRAYARTSVEHMLVEMSQAKLLPVHHLFLKGTRAKEMEAIIKRACAADPNERYASADALAQDLRRFLHGEELEARPDGYFGRITRWVGRNRERTLLIATALVLVGAIAGSWALIERQQTIIDAELRENHIASVVTETAEQAQRIERHFLGFEAIVTGLSAAATQLVTYGVQTEIPSYTNDDFADLKKLPEDTTFSSVYGIPISLNWPVFKIAPGAEPKTIDSLRAKLSPLAGYFKRVMFESVAGEHWQDKESDIKKSILEQGAALTWAYVGLEAGLHFAYPGKTGYPAEYDPRKRPWYRESSENRGIKWLTPYIDVSGRGLVVTCTHPMRDVEGELIGIAGVEMTLEHLQRELLRRPEWPRSQASFLLDDTGRVVASSGAVARRFAAGTLVDKVEDLDRYSEPEIVKRVRRADSGHYIGEQANGDEILYIYHRLGSIRWYLVVEAPLER